MGERLRMLRYRVESVLMAIAILALAAVVIMLELGVLTPKPPAPRSVVDPVTMRQADLAEQRAALWETRARACAGLLSSETGAAYDPARGDIERSAARATAWAEHVTELEEAYGD